MKNPSPLNLLTPEEVRALGWTAETRDSDGHLIRTNAAFVTDGDILWLVREAMEHGETVTIWPSLKPGMRELLKAASSAAKIEKMEGRLDR